MDLHTEQTRSRTRRLDVFPLSFACIAPMLCMCESTLPGMPWVGWALGEGLALARGWVGLARPLEPVAHHKQ